MFLDFNMQRDILIVTLKGELDHNSAEEVRVKIDDKIDMNEAKNIILDFSGVSFMYSSGIGAVMGRYKKISYRGGNLFISNVNKNVNKIFELAGLYKVIKKYNTIEEAVGCI